MNTIMILSILLYVIIGMVLWLIKPSLMFNSNGSVKSFGVQEDQTIFYFPIVLIFMAIIIYIIFLRLLSN
jgi:hypothetical protein